MSRKPVTFEGLTADEILKLPTDEINELVFNREALVVSIGSAQILGRFSIGTDRLVVELAQIDGGGEGVLPAIGSLASKLARQRGLHKLEWQVHAVACAEPNLKLRKMLVNRGFEIREVEEIGEVFHQVVTISPGAGQS